MYKVHALTILSLALLLSACQTNNFPVTTPSTTPSAAPTAVAEIDPNDLPGSQPTPQPNATATPAPAASPTPLPEPTPTASLPAGLSAIRLTADNRHFSSKGETTHMHVTLLDAQGREIQGSVPLSWSSTAPDSFSVDASGQVTALVNYGYADIVVLVPGTNLSAKLLVSATAYT